MVLGELQASPHAEQDESKCTAATPLRLAFGAVPGCGTSVGTWNAHGSLGCPPWDAAALRFAGFSCAWETMGIFLECSCHCAQQAPLAATFFWEVWHKSHIVPFVELSRHALPRYQLRVQAGIRRFLGNMLLCLFECVDGAAQWHLLRIDADRRCDPGMPVVPFKRSAFLRCFEPWGGCGCRSAAVLLVMARLTCTMCTKPLL